MQKKRKYCYSIFLTLRFEGQELVFKLIFGTRVYELNYGFPKLFLNTTEEFLVVSTVQIVTTLEQTVEDVLSK